MCVCVVYVYHVVFFHSFIDRQLGCFPALAIVSNYRISASKGFDVGWHQEAAIRTGGWPGLCLPTWKNPLIANSASEMGLSLVLLPYSLLGESWADLHCENYTRSVRLAFFLIYSILCRLIYPHDCLVLPLSGPASKVNPSTHHRLKWSLPSLCLGHWLCSVGDCLFLLWAATSSSSLSACHCNLIVSYMPFPISISHGA